MNKLELFKMCNQDEIYTQIGDGVDYAFIEDPGTATLHIFFEPSDICTLFTMSQFDNNSRLQNEMGKEN